jgi:hypothetical protein
MTTRNAVILANSVTFSSREFTERNPRMVALTALHVPILFLYSSLALTKQRMFSHVLQFQLINIIWYLS